MLILKSFANYIFIPMLIFSTSCQQNQTEVKKTTNNLEPKGVITSHNPDTSVRAIKQDNSGSFGQKENSSKKISKTKMTSGLVQKDIIAVKHTYIPPHVIGDKDFDENCDISSTATLKISDDRTKLYIKLYYKVKEPYLDKTEASGTETFIIYDTKDSKKKIVKILTGTIDSGSFIYRSDNELHLIFEPYTIYAEWDLINGVPGGGGKALKLIQRASANFTKDFTKNGLIKKWVFVGDTNSEFDAGSQTKVTIETDIISILVQEN